MRRVGSPATSVAALQRRTRFRPEQKERPRSLAEARPRRVSGLVLLNQIWRSDCPEAGSVGASADRGAVDRVDVTGSDLGSVIARIFGAAARFDIDLRKAFDRHRAISRTPGKIDRRNGHEARVAGRDVIDSGLASIAGIRDRRA